MHRTDTAVTSGEDPTCAVPSATIMAPQAWLEKCCAWWRSSIPKQQRCRRSLRQHHLTLSFPGLVNMLLVLILCVAHHVRAGDEMLDGKSKEHDFPLGQDDMFGVRAKNDRCTRVDLLLQDMWEVANEANVKEGLEFMREVEVAVEKGTVCQTPTSACVMSKFRDACVDMFLLGKRMQECSAGHVEAREGSCEDLRTLRERMDQVVHEHASEKGLVENIRESAFRLLERAECKGPQHMGANCRRLPICTIPK